MQETTLEPQTQVRSPELEDSYLNGGLWPAEYLV